MKRLPVAGFEAWQLILAATVCFQAHAAVAETNLVRIAVVQFTAPAGNQKLQSEATVLPDLLTASLSHDSRFQLVEREKINTLWSELHLTEAGLTAADTVARLGKVLACDWLVSGSFVQTETGPQIWVKIIDTQSSVVLDLQSLPANATNLSVTVTDIGGFLAQARSRAHPHEFIALESFEDRTAASVTLEDWTPRLTALLEKHFLTAGYGVVERESVAPIFSEYQLESGGLTADAAKRVKLKPAFWVIGGSWKWLPDAQNKLNVTINIRKMGGGEQILSLTKPPGAELETAMVDAIQDALKESGSMTDEQALAGEEKLRREHLDVLMVKREGARLPPRLDTNTTYITITNFDGSSRQVPVDPAWKAQRDGHKEDMLRTLQQAILLNPKDMKSKYVLGRALFGSVDPVDSRNGEKFLEEVAASDDTTFSTLAKEWLDDVRSGRIQVKRDQFGMAHVEIHGQPASLPNSNVVAKSLDPWQARMAALREITNVAPRANSFTTFPGPPPQEFNLVSAAKLWRQKIFIAGGTTLQCYDTESGELTDINLPGSWNHAITAIEADEAGLWLGTDRGLFRLTSQGEKIREYGVKDGLPSSPISALRLSAGKLFIGFNSWTGGTFGWLDLATDKFTGIMSPFGPIRSMVTPDAKTFWVGTPASFQQLDVASQKLSPFVPDGFKGRAINRFLGGAAIDMNAKHLAILMPSRCVAIYRFDSKQWKSVNVSTNEGENTASSLAFDPSNPDWLWIGGDHGSLTLLNLESSQVITRGETASLVGTEWVFPTTNSVTFIARNIPSGFELYRLEKSKLFGTTTAVPMADTSAQGQTGAGAAKPDEIKNVAGKSAHFFRFGNAEVIGYLNGGSMTAFGSGGVLGQGSLVIASGTSLKTFDWTGSFGFGSGTDFEKAGLPLKVDHPITAIENDPSDLWLGTDGGGLIKIPKSGAAPRIFGENDGLPMLSIKTLRSTPDRLLIGFGRNQTGAMGYLDTNTLKFTGLTPPGTSGTWEGSLQPAPLSPVLQIKTEDDTNTFWVSTAKALYRLKLDSKQWTRSLPAPNLPDYLGSAGFRTLSVSDGFVAAIIPSGGVALGKLPDNQWTRVNLSANPAENQATTLAIDNCRPAHLWIGRPGKIIVVDLETHEILGECNITMPGAIEFMYVLSGDVFFIGDDIRGGYELYHLDNPFFKSKP